MEKIILKDGSEIQINDGATENIFVVPYENESEISTMVSNLTVDNLSEIKLYNSSEVLCTTILNKKLSTYITNVDEKTVAFNLKDVSELEKRIIELETTQELQDEAITELATIASESEV